MKHIVRLPGRPDDHVNAAPRGAGEHRRVQPLHQLLALGLSARVLKAQDVVQHQDIEARANNLALENTVCLDAWVFRDSLALHGDHRLMPRVLLSLAWAHLREHFGDTLIALDVSAHQAQQLLRLIYRVADRRDAQVRVVPQQVEDFAHYLLGLPVLHRRDQDGASVLAPKLMPLLVEGGVFQDAAGLLVPDRVLHEVLGTRTRTGKLRGLLGPGTRGRRLQDLRRREGYGCHSGSSNAKSPRRPSLPGRTLGVLVLGSRWKLRSGQGVQPRQLEAEHPTWCAEPATTWVGTLCAARAACVCGFCFHGLFLSRALYQGAIKAATWRPMSRYWHEHCFCAG